MGLWKRVRTLWALGELQSFPTPEGYKPVLPEYPRAVFIPNVSVEEIFTKKPDATLDDVIQR